MILHGAFIILGLAVAFRQDVSLGGYMVMYGFLNAVETRLRGSKYDF